MRYQGSEEVAPAYPVLPGGAADLRADEVVARIDLAREIALDERLTAYFRGSLGAAAARALANVTYDLYNLLADLRAASAAGRDDAVALRRAVVLALSRPSGTPMWEDYRAYVAAVVHAQAQADVDDAVWAPVLVARRHFTHTWRV